MPSPSAVLAEPSDSIILGSVRARLTAQEAHASSSLNPKNGALPLRQYNLFDRVAIISCHDETVTLFGLEHRYFDQTERQADDLCHRAPSSFSEECKLAVDIIRKIE